MWAPQGGCGPYGGGVSSIRGGEDPLRWGVDPMGGGGPHEGLWIPLGDVGSHRRSIDPIGVVWDPMVGPIGGMFMGFCAPPPLPSSA